MPYSCRLGPAAGTASIVVVAREGDPSLEELKGLPADAKVVFQGCTIEEFSTPAAKEALQDANVMLNCIGGKELLGELHTLMPKLSWIHNRFAGVDSMIYPALVESDNSVCLTNARGLFSPSLAEYVVLSCLYFAKDVDRWKRQQQEKKWEKFVITEHPGGLLAQPVDSDTTIAHEAQQQIKGKTLGVIGYGDIGQTSARMAKGMGMKIIGQRRRPELSADDGIADEMFGPGQVGDVIAKSDYILVAAALTKDSQGMVGAAELARAQPHAVIISVGRGPLIDEDTMTAMLQDGRLRGAALDVFCTEPLPTESPLWDMENVLLSPHNADLTATFLHDSVRLLVDNMPEFLAGGEVSIHRVDPKAGY